MDVEFKDNSQDILSEFRQAAVRALEKCGLTAEEYAKKLCPSPESTGDLRDRIAHKVDPEALEAYIGTNVEYAA